MQGYVEFELPIKMSDKQDVSAENAKKLDRLIFLMEGAGEDTPGIVHKLNEHDLVLMGQRGEPGLMSKVNIMWRVHVWLLCSLSGLVGYWLKTGLETLFK